MPSSAHRRVAAVLLATVLALFCAFAGTGSPGAGAVVPPYDRTGAAAPGPVAAAGTPGGFASAATPAAAAAAAVAGGATAEAGRTGAGGRVAASDARERGPRCGPGPAAPDRAPAVPARAGAHLDHALAACARPALPGGAAPCFVPGPPCGARGPDRPAPGPVELSVMRV
ncbi:hypothetical protein ACFVGY_24370 [Streptomyces sp. NPDC127106]|uniref:hypothetical protein n=1 Tax=Streptomyces sp. NPDC127106 TaxID=3345360 RepID=UPI0036386D9E